jgi:hypothetical protein
VRTLGIVISAALASLFLLMSLDAFFGSDRQRNADRRINMVFTQASNYVRDFENVQGRLPLQSEFADWVNAQSHAERGTIFLRDVSYQLGIPPQELVDAMGAPVTSTYYLSLWRGEWFEYYAPWVQRSTIEPSDLKWYLTTHFFMGAVFLTIGVGLLLLCRVLALWSNRRMQPTPETGATDPRR